MVFFGDTGGNFYALDAATGQKLWGRKLGGALGGGVITYTAGGAQKVAVATGLANIYWPTDVATGKIVVLGLRTCSLPGGLGGCHLLAGGHGHGPERGLSAQRAADLKDTRETCAANHDLYFLMLFTLASLLRKLIHKVSDPAIPRRRSCSSLGFNYIQFGAVRRGIGRHDSSI